MDNQLQTIDFNKSWIPNIKWVPATRPKAFAQSLKIYRGWKERHAYAYWIKLYNQPLPRKLKKRLKKVVCPIIYDLSGGYEMIDFLRRRQDNL